MVQASTFVNNQNRRDLFEASAAREPKNPDKGNVANLTDMGRMMRGEAVYHLVRKLDDTVEVEVSCSNQLDVEPFVNSTSSAQKASQLVAAEPSPRPLRYRCLRRRTHSLQRSLLQRQRATPRSAKSQVYLSHSHF
jgi:hypothetical protein